MAQNYYMVRAMDSTDPYFRAFFDNGIVGVGWSKVNFSAYASSEELREVIYHAYYAETSQRSQTVSKKLNEAERFKKIQTGDYIIVPYNSGIVLAEVAGEERYATDAMDLDLANQHTVQYRRKDGELLVIPRNELSEGLQRRLRVPGSSVSNLYEFRDEIDRLFSADSYTYSGEFKKKETAHFENLRRSLLDRIQQGNTNLQTGGIGLERLICELLRIEGYDAQVLDKKKFSGNADADVEAHRTDTFSCTKLFVQAKHHSGISPRDGIQQIVDVLAQTDDGEYEGWFITTAAISSEDKQFATKHGIRVMEGNALVDLILSVADRLPEEWRTALGFSKYPSLL